MRLNINEYTTFNKYRYLGIENLLSCRYGLIMPIEFDILGM